MAARRVNYRSVYISQLPVEKCEVDFIITETSHRIKSQNVVRFYGEQTA
jgi:hypothetical protein